MYTISNSNLLFHASCPLNDDGSLKEVEVYPGVSYSGKDLMHNIGMIIRAAFEGPSDDYPLDYARDYFLYLWCGKNSPLFDKSKMATFERSWMLLRYKAVIVILSMVMCPYMPQREKIPLRQVES